MAKIVDILPTSDRLKCKAGENCSVDFSFTNTTPRSLRVGGKLVAADPAIGGWFKPKGATEWDLEPKAADKCSIGGKIPPDAKPGAYTFQFMVFDVKNPEDEYDLSQTVRVEVEEAEKVVAQTETTGFPWWIVAAVAGVLAVAGLAAWLLLRNGDVTVPDVAGQNVEAAKSALQSASLAVTQMTEISSLPVDQVLRTDPAAGSSVKKNSQVVLIVAGRAAKVDVPNLISVNIEDAERLLQTMGLKPVRKQPLKAAELFKAGQVVSQSPALGAKVDPGTPVELEVAGDSIKIPRVKGMQLPAAMQAMANAGLFVEVTGDQNKLQEPVVATNPSEGTLVLKGSRVQIQMPGIRIVIPVDLIRTNPLFTNKLQIMRQVMPDTAPGETQNR